MARHTRGLSSLDVTNLDVEGASGGRVDQDYFQGLPVLSSFQQARLPWSARGPAAASHRSVAATWHDAIGIVPSARMHLAWAKAGWSDSLKVKEVTNVVSGSPAIRVSIVKGLVLSLAVVLLIFFFELAFFPAQLYLRDGDGSDANHQSGNVLWLYPVVAVSYFVASSWTVDVAKTAYSLKHGRGLSLSGVASGLSSTNTRRWLLQESFRVLLVVNYLLVAIALQHIPWLGRTIAFAFMSFVDAFYCFDPVLASRGWPVERRLRYVESRWAYMTAFGIPPTAISFFHPSGLLNLFLFMAVYPFCTVLALLANPQPHSVPGGSSSTPLSTHAGSSFADHQHFGSGGAKGASSASLPAGSSLSPFLPARLPIFLPTAFLYRLAVRFAPPADDYDDFASPPSSSKSFKSVPSYAAAAGDPSARMYASGGYGMGGPSSSPRGAWGAQPGPAAAVYDGAGAGASSHAHITGIAGTAAAGGGGGSFGRRTAAQFVGGAWGNANGSVAGAGSRFSTAAAPSTPPIGQAQWAYAAPPGSSPSATPALGVPPAGRQPYAYAGSNPSSRSTSPIPPPPKRGAAGAAAAAAGTGTNAAATNGAGAVPAPTGINGHVNGIGNGNGIGIGAPAVPPPPKGGKKMD